MERLVNVTIGHRAPPAPSLNRRWFSRAVFGFQKTRNRPQRTTGRTAKSGSSLKSGGLRGIGRINIFHYAVSRAVKRKTMETTLKNHGSQPKTMKNHETTLKNHGNHHE